MKQIAIMHYASPPGIGGVEVTIAHQARILAGMGYGVVVVSGVGGDFDPQVKTVINPLLSSSHPDILAVQKELAQGQVTDAYHALVKQIAAALETALEGIEVCIAHNIPTLHKNLPLTAALAAYVERSGMRLVAYCHDLAWTNPQYQAELHPGEPWDKLRQVWPDARYATVSVMRQQELADLLGVPPEQVTVITGGVDPAQFLKWTATTSQLVEKLHLMDADGILLLPARLTRRKNIELGLRVLAAVRQQSGKDFRLVVTGPPGPHNPSNHAYLSQLLQLRAELGLDAAAHFLYREGPDPQSPLELDDDTIADCYRLADALCFPSTQEGFGIPVLEAGLSGIPVFCSDLPPLRQSGGDEAVYFDPLRDSPEAIAAQIVATLNTSSTYRLRVRVRQQYRWETIIQKSLIPLIEE
ncbi:MAG: glycosyltransferase [Chloroflexi bacterium]|nr:glycosyltransferase [Chloroflexota bacterium]MCC6897237.1 glycosyltransferase [Anaerolineae bacterium]